MKRRRERITYDYECTMTGQQFKMTEKAPHPKELMSIRAYYEMHPEKDDRPAIVKKKLGIAQAEADAEAQQAEENLKH